MVEIVNAVLYGGLAIAGIIFWSRRRTQPAAWLALTFLTLGVIVVQGLFDLSAGDRPVPQFSPRDIYTDFVILGLLTAPWLLFRFVRSLERRTATDLVVDVGMVLIGIAVFAMPALRADDGPTPLRVTLFLIVALVWWTGLMCASSWLLWHAGKGHPGVVRLRMQLMSIACLTINAAFLGRILVRDGGQVTELLVAALGWAGALGFWLGVEPPGALRRAWRLEDEITLRAAEAALVRADTAEAAGDAVVRPAARLVGGTGARIEDVTGRVLATFGQLDEDGEGETLRVEGDVSAVTVAVSPYTPVFGRDEQTLLLQLCHHLDLALRRMRAYEDSERARLQVHQANEDLQQLVYGISHDLRNPLVTILGFLSILQVETDQLTEHGRIAVDRIGASAQYMDNLIQDLLQLSRIGRTDSDPAEVDLAALVVDIAEDVRARHEDVEVDVGTDATVVMNPVRARQLFTNLLENAARHGGRRPLLIIVRTAATTETSVTIDVADDGVGIPAEERERVFQIFQRLAAFDASAPGSGIGLTMCRRIVEDAGGTISIADSDVGTTLRVELPTPATTDAETPLQQLGADA